MYGFVLEFKDVICFSVDSVGLMVDIEEPKICNGSVRIGCTLLSAVTDGFTADRFDSIDFSNVVMSVMF